MSQSTTNIENDNHQKGNKFLYQNDNFFLGQTQKLYSTNSGLKLKDINRKSFQSDLIQNYPFPIYPYPSQSLQCQFRAVNNYQKDYSPIKTNPHISSYPDYYRKNNIQCEQIQQIKQSSPVTIKNFQEVASMFNAIQASPQTGILGVKRSQKDRNFMKKLRYLPPDTTKVLFGNFTQPIFKIIKGIRYIFQSFNQLYRKSKQQVHRNFHYSRKEKSLGELSRRFLQMFGVQNQCDIEMETVLKGDEYMISLTYLRVQEQCTERGKTIINGVVQIPLKALFQMQSITSSQLFKFSQFRRQIEIEKEIVQCQLNNKSFDSEIAYELRDLKAQQIIRIGKKKKSLGILSTGFIRLFFTWKKVISLEQAARRLTTNANADKENKIKTKIRRLYDIANVFQALGLIVKTQLDTKKPAFKWIGISGLDNFIMNLKKTVQQKNNQQGQTPRNIQARDTFRSFKSAFKTPKTQKPKQFLLPSFDTFNKKMLNLFSGLCETTSQKIEKPIIPVFEFKNKQKSNKRSFKPIPLRNNNSAPLQRKLQFLTNMENQNNTSKEQRKREELTRINILNSFSQQSMQAPISNINPATKSLFTLLQAKNTRRRQNVLIKRPLSCQLNTNSSSFTPILHVQNQISFESIKKKFR